jgi:DNA-binding helix-hairpin-helix protein with protein kinase domain
MTENSESKQMRREMQEKLNKQYIDTKVHPIIEPMANALFSQAGPNDDPVSLYFLLMFFRLNSC